MDFSNFINTISGTIMENSNYSRRQKMIFDLFKLQNQLNELYDMYVIEFKNSNESAARKLIKKYSNNIRNKHTRANSFQIKNSFLAKNYT